MQAAHHWDVLARHEATQILQRERVRFRDFYITPQKKAAPLPIVAASLVGAFVLCSPAS